MTEKWKIYGTCGDEDVNQWFTVGTRVSTIIRTLGQKLGLKTDSFNVYIQNSKTGEKLDAFLKVNHSLSALSAFRNLDDAAIYFHYINKDEDFESNDEQSEEEDDYSSSDDDFVEKKKSRSSNNFSSTNAKKPPIVEENEIDKLESKISNVMQMLDKIKHDSNFSLSDETCQPVINVCESGILNVYGAFYQFGSITAGGFSTGNASSTSMIPKYVNIKNPNAKEVKNVDKLIEKEVSSSANISKELTEIDLTKNQESKKSKKGKPNAIVSELREFIPLSGKKSRLRSNQSVESDDESESELENESESESEAEVFLNAKSKNNENEKSNTIEKSAETKKTTKKNSTAKKSQSAEKINSKKNQIEHQNPISNEVLYDEWIKIIGMYFVALLEKWGYNGTEIINFVGAQQYLLRLYEISADNCKSLQESIDKTLSTLRELTPKELKEFVVDLDNFLF
eukprot:TRINITY_DN903_c0_g1_i1.p1 TRINITY_DN903_c0_g1~~TRINITY_DN903_c0_g1_i1.p1  ORF type:complete len:466 (-),score=160.82 TRINITY_DN903_c0_g1_i1:139-1500(-)